METTTVYSKRFKKNGQASSKPFVVARFTFEADAIRFVEAHNKSAHDRNKAWAFFRQSNGYRRRVA